MGVYDVVSFIVITGLVIIAAVACIGHYGFRCNDPSRPGWPDRELVRLSFKGYKPWIRRWPVQNADADRVDDGAKFTVNAEGVVLSLEEAEDELTKQIKQQASHRGKDLEEGIGGSRPPASSEGPELQAKQPPPRPKAVAAKAAEEGAATTKPTPKTDAAKLTKLSLKERRAQEKAEGSSL
jgi:hypothetical protein